MIVTHDHLNLISMLARHPEVLTVNQSLDDCPEYMRELVEMGFATVIKKSNRTIGFRKSESYDFMLKLFGINPTST